MGRASLIIADTHTLIWWVTDPSQLSVTARNVMDRSNAICVATITCLEVALLAQRRRIAIHEDVLDWLHTVTTLPRVTLLPLTIEVTVTAARIRDPFRDPVDRIIVATALHQGVPLVTKDHKIIDARVVHTIW